MQTSLNHRRHHPFFQSAIRGLVLSLALGLALPSPAIALRTEAGLESTTESNLERNLVGETSSTAGLEEQEEKYAERVADDKATIEERRASAVSLALLDTDKAREILKRIVSSPQERKDSRIIAAGVLPLSSDPEILSVLLAVLTSQDRRNLSLRLFLPEVLRHLLFSSESEIDQVLDALRQNVSPIFEQAHKGYTPQIRRMFQMSVGMTRRIVQLERRRVIAQRDFSELGRSLQQREEALKGLRLPSAIPFLGQILDDPDPFQADPFVEKIVSTLSFLMEALRAHSLSLPKGSGQAWKKGRKLGRGFIVFCPARRTSAPCLCCGILIKWTLIYPGSMRH